MIGAIAGDMIGSLYEGNPVKHNDFYLYVSAFTDDTVLTIAIAHAILNDSDIAFSLKKFAQKYHSLPYGRGFKRWIWSWKNEPYNSFGNGSAMRVSPVGFAYDAIEDVLHQAKRTAEVTHNHPEGIKGAQAYYNKIPEDIVRNVKDKLPCDLRKILEKFNYKYMCAY